MDQSAPRPVGRAELRCVRALLRASDPAGVLAALLAEGPDWIAAAGSALRLPDGDGVLRPVAGSGAVDPAGPDVSVVLPLVADGAPVGSLTLALTRGGPVPREDVELLETFAEAAAHRLARLARPTERAASAAVRAAGAGVFERDLVTGETRWDVRAHRVVGRAPGPDGLAPEPASVVHPEDLPELRAGLAEALAAGGPYRLSYRAVRPDGSVVLVDEAGEVVLDGDRRPVRAAGLLTGREWRPGPPGPGGEGARSTLLLALTRALTRAVTVREVTAALTDVVRPALGASEVVLDLVDQERLLPMAPVSRGGRSGADGSDGAAEHAARATPLFGGPDVPGPGAPPAWTVLPLVASGRQVGSCLITFADGRGFDPGDRTMFSAFAGILAQSLERARLYDVHHERAGELQRAMLPRSLPVLPSIASAARYLPSTEGMQVGGDWYDLLRLPGGRVGLVIGDVQGHHAEATAVMGQLRSGLWAYATDGDGDDDPAAVLERTSRLLSRMETELFATCLYVVLDPATGALRAARAGHPQPVRIGAGGAAELELPGGPPLGVLPGVRYPSARARLERGETLLAYTDGLVETRGEDYDVSVRRLLGGLRRWTAEAGGAERLGRPGALERLADLLAPSATEREVRPDDVALLLLHRSADGSSTDRPRQ
ncbi:SpoIIE family protein phosphatase [Kitasatospora sp. NPDC088391]|uniref:SpoIIE family protein phosphatase n=1 Tax=Kitasatospora sp. NPDC088391 TaxID=3364074 RepID=UPI0038302A3A